MQIPEQFLPYNEKTCIFVCDHVHAKVYQAFQNDFNFFEEVTDTRAKLDDIERYSQGDGSLHFSAQDEGFKEREAHLFYKQLARKLFDLKQSQSFEKLVLVLPEEDKNIFVDLLHEDVKHSIEQIVPKQLTNLSEDQLVEAIDKARRII